MKRKNKSETQPNKLYCIAQGSTYILHFTPLPRDTGFNKNNQDFMSLILDAWFPSLTRHLNNVQIVCYSDPVLSTLRLVQGKNCALENRCYSRDLNRELV